MSLKILSGDALFDFENSKLSENKIPLNFKKIKAFGNISIYTGIYNNSKIEIFFENNILLKKIISSLDDSIFDFDFNSITSKYKNNLLTEIKLNYVSYELNSTYYFDEIDQCLKLDFNSQNFLTEEKKTFEIIKIIGEYDLSKILKKNDWFSTFNSFLKLLDNKEKHSELSFFMKNSEINFKEPNDNLFYIINLNFFP